MKGMTIEFAEEASEKLAGEVIEKLKDIYGDKIQIYRKDNQYRKGIPTNHWFVGIKGDRHADDSKPNPKAWSIQIIPEVRHKGTGAHDEWCPYCVVYFADPKFPRIAERTTVRGAVNQSCKALNERLHHVVKLYLS